MFNEKRIQFFIIIQIYSIQFDSLFLNADSTATRDNNNNSNNNNNNNNNKAVPLHAMKALGGEEV
jgi:hypothetical protein